MLSSHYYGYKSFTYTRTGDTAVYKDGAYSILGRTSVDIIKNGGYKISALDIERHLLSHPSIAEAVVVGLPDLTWGQKVAAIVVLRPKTNLTLIDLTAWAKDLMPPYHIPTVLRILDAIPRNDMSKVNKKTLLKEVFAKEMKVVG